MRVLDFLLLSFLLSFPTYAKDLGVYGATFEIQERDLLVVIQEKLQKRADSGELAKHQEKCRTQTSSKNVSVNACKNFQVTSNNASKLNNGRLFNEVFDKLLFGVQYEQPKLSGYFCRCS